MIFSTIFIFNFYQSCKSADIFTNYYLSIYYRIMEESNSKQQNQQKQQQQQITQPHPIQIPFQTQHHLQYQQSQNDISNIPSSSKQIKNQQQNQQPQSSRKFTKTPQQTQDYLCLQQLQHSHTNLNEQQTNPVAVANFVVQELITHILQKFQSFVDLLQKAGQIAIKQTFNILINDPSLGISNGHMLLKQHTSSALAQDTEPKSSVYIDGSIGHVKIKQLTKISKKESCFSINKHYTISNNNTEKQKQKKRISKYTSLHKKNSIKDGNILPPILDRYHSMLPQLKNQLSFQQKQAQYKKEKNKKSSTTVSSKMQPPELIDLEVKNKQSDDNFINYLRFVKVQADKYWSMNSTQRNEFINQYNPDIEISSLKKSKNPINPKQVSRRNSLSNIEIHIEDKLITQKNKTRKAIPDNYYTLDNINQEIITPVVLGKIKKNKNYQSYVSVLGGQQAQCNVFSYDGQLIKQISKNVKQTRKLIQMQSKKNIISDQSFHSNLKKMKNKNKKNSDQIEEESQNRNIKLPKISIKNKKSKMIAQDQLSVWVNREKKKQFQNKFIEFMNANICASGSICELKTGVKEYQHSKQSTPHQMIQKIGIEKRQSQKQNKRNTNNPVLKTNKNINKQNRKSLDHFQLCTYRS